MNMTQIVNSFLTIDLVYSTVPVIFITAVFIYSKLFFLFGRPLKNLISFFQFGLTVPGMHILELGMVCVRVNSNRGKREAMVMVKISDGAVCVA